MTVYLNPKLVANSFFRLTSKADVGKRPMERTSGLMYFLAFDAAAKKLRHRPLDLDPGTTNGKNNRDVMSLEFVKFVLLKEGADHQARHVIVLGKVEKGGNPPEKRISSNFLTVSVKKASESTKSVAYPNRPAPLLKMGKTATDTKWGIDYHDDWEKNILTFLADTKSKSPFTDLAVFVFRDTPIPKAHNDLRAALSSALKNRFSDDLAKFWSQRLNAEKIFFKFDGDQFSDSYQDSLAESEFSAIGGVSDRAAFAMEFLKLKTALASRLGGALKSEKSAVLFPLSVLPMVRDLLDSAEQSPEISETLRTYEWHAEAREKI